MSLRVRLRSIPQGLSRMERDFLEALDRVQGELKVCDDTQDRVYLMTLLAIQHKALDDLERVKAILDWCNSQLEPSGWCKKTTLVVDVADQ